MELFHGYDFPMDTYWENYRNGGFTQLSMDFSSRCNLNCLGCFNGHLLNQPEPDILTVGERIKLMETSVGLGARTLIVPGTGEPTLDPFFRETIQAAHDLGLITVVYSNLTGKVDNKIIAFMYEHNVSMGIKFDTLVEEYFKFYYQTTSAMWEKFWKNFPAVLETYSNAAHTRLVANMVLTRKNTGEPELIKESCEKNDLPLYIRPIKPVDWAAKDPELWKVLGNRFGLPLPENELVMLAKKYNTLFSPSSTEENHCALFSFGLTIKANGDVQLCPDHHKSRGEYNVRRNSMEEIMEHLNSKRKIEKGYCVMLDGIQH